VYEKSRGWLPPSSKPEAGIRRARNTGNIGAKSGRQNTQ